MQSVHVDPSTPIKDVDNLQFINGETGENMGAGLMVPKWFRLRRSKLRSLMAKDLDIKYNKKLTHIAYASIDDENTVIAQFADGTVAHGRILVGADGARSSVRSLIMDPDMAKIARLPYAATFVQARYTREQALFLRSFHPLYLAAPHPKGNFAFFGLQDAPDPDAPETWTFFFYISWQSSIAQQDEEKETFTMADRLKQVRALSEYYTEPWKSAMAWVPDDQPCFYLGLTVWDPSLQTHSWWNQDGRVTLAGDAAHPMTYREYRPSFLQ
jgi:2-polyprenyl-6-methoxyphenol hydroxylase-like FAD-dependent oxidoreductase